VPLSLLKNSCVKCWLGWLIGCKKYHSVLWVGNPGNKVPRVCVLLYIYDYIIAYLIQYHSNTSTYDATTLKKGKDEDFH